MYLQSHAVADQFSLAALGGVGYEALTLGTRLITNLDASALATFFGACPPAFIADTPQAVAASIRAIAADPLDQAGRGAAAAEWARRYHSTARLHELQVGTYRDLLQCPEGPRDAPQPARGKAE